jgi:transcriptional regulator with XRE-family HTH domain
MFIYYIGNVSLEAKIAERLRSLRKGCRFSLQQLASQSGVSRSMISLIERGETSPTAAVLNKLAAALNTPLASLFLTDVEAYSPHSLRADQQVWMDPATGYVRRSISPMGKSLPIKLVEVTFPAGERITFENVFRQSAVHQQVVMLEGELEVTLEDGTWRLAPGDCLAMTLGSQIAFHNPSNKPARYMLALAGLDTMRRQ